MLVLHHDKVGDSGRLRLARATGPAGRLAWDADLALAHLSATMFGESTLAFVGTVPDPTYEPYSEVSRDKHEVLVFVNDATGSVARYDLTAESVVDADAPEAVTTEPQRHSAPIPDASLHEFQRLTRFAGTRRITLMENTSAPTPVGSVRSV